MPNMDSSIDNESSNTPASLGTVMADVLQEQMLNNSENSAQSAIPYPRGSTSEIDNMIVPLILENPNTTNSNETFTTCEPTVVETGTSVIEAFDTFENRLSSIGNNSGENATNDQDFSRIRSSTCIRQLQAQSSNTNDRCEPMQSLSGRHIMISYHHDSSFQICRRIRDRLQERGYRIWMDINDLHGSIHQGMADAVENSYVVLFCMNHHYYQSEFCKKEALYTDKIHTEFIPCLLETAYRPQGWLGIIIGDQLYIDFSSPDNFDKAFEELVAEIQAVEQRLQRSSSIQRIDSSSTNSSTSQRTETLHSLTPEISLNDSVRDVVREFRDSITRSNHDAQSLNEEEFSQLMNYIRRRISIDSNTSVTHHEPNRTREILEELLQHSRTQTEFLRQITEILSSMTDRRAIIKLSLAVAVIWTFNKFLNR